MKAEGYPLSRAYCEVVVIWKRLGSWEGGQRHVNNEPYGTLIDGKGVCVRSWFIWVAQTVSELTYNSSWPTSSASWWRASGSAVGDRWKIEKLKKWKKWLLLVVWGRNIGMLISQSLLDFLPHEVSFSWLSIGVGPPLSNFCEVPCFS